MGMFSLFYSMPRHPPLTSLIFWKGIAVAHSITAIVFSHTFLPPGKQMARRLATPMYNWFIMALWEWLAIYCRHDGAQVRNILP